MKNDNDDDDFWQISTKQFVKFERNLKELKALRAEMQKARRYIRVLEIKRDMNRQSSEMEIDRLKDRVNSSTRAMLKYRQRWMEVSALIRQINTPEQVHSAIAELKGINHARKSTDLS